MEQERLEILPNRKKRILLLFPLAGLIALVWYTSKFMSVLFLIYTAVLVWALVHLIFRIFSNKPVLVLTKEGILSNMTPNGKEAGLVFWRDVTDIREMRTFWFIRSIAVFTHESKNTFRLHLADDEAAIDHDQLLAVIKLYWEKYR
ncbi:hypothetical protein C7T94_14225 [Pedobacter yulinensis]|uniref:Uncharacterized protein n=1 Tax=Pedobacter yulinensis TaxID=2126353 RepID=A0A2T3HMM0_9SPHI|nr:hypothetical protein [Pedobacter yulinensis]PST83684.1 hypothetical protein C7T94_14225 [Pedobacter yulinensis]